MKKSYIGNRDYPEIKLPLSALDLHGMTEAANVPVQTKYVAKSDRLVELEKELQMAKELLSQISVAERAWDRGAERKLKLDEMCPPYDEYRLDGTRGAIQERIAGTKSIVAGYTAQVDTAVRAVFDAVNQHYDRIHMEYEIEKKGVEGEEEVEAYISRGLGCHLLSGVVLPSVQDRADAPKTAETDLLVITSCGVFVCEIKNYGRAGQSLKIMHNGMIEKFSRDGTLLETLPSPFAQNERHCKAVRKALENAGLGDVPVYPAVIIANPDVEIINKQGLHISNMHDFCKSVREMYGSVATEEKQLAMLRAITAQRMTERRFPLQSIRPLYVSVQSVVPALLRVTQTHSSWISQVEKEVQAWVEQKTHLWVKRHPLQVFYRRYMEDFFASLVGSVIAVFIAAIFVVFWGIYISPDGFGRPICGGAILTAYKMLFYMLPAGIAFWNVEDRLCSRDTKKVSLWNVVFNITICRVIYLVILVLTTAAFAFIL